MEFFDKLNERLTAHIDQCNAAKDSAITALLEIKGFSLEEAKKRCRVVEFAALRRSVFLIDNVPHLEWGALDPANPNAWALRTWEDGRDDLPIDVMDGKL